MTTWTLEPQSGGSVLLTWKRQRKTFGTREEAMAFVRKNRSPQDRVVEVQQDGYTVPVTRRRWRKPGMHL